MARVRITTEDGLPWIWAKNSMSGSVRNRPDEGPEDTKYRIREAGSETAPYLIEIGYPPDAVIDPHAHTEDEILYVVAGEMHLGNRIAGPGSSVFVAKDTLYGFRAGPTGVQFLNFRPRKAGTITREEFLATRRQAKTN